MTVERPVSCPREGEIPSFDAGWVAHEVGISRETVRVIAADRDWALLGWDTRHTLASRQREDLSSAAQSE